MWSSEFLWQAFYTKIRSNYVLGGHEYEVIKKMDAESCEVYLMWWSDRMHDTVLPKPPKRAVIRMDW
jgi:hypothetical protein